MDVAAVVKIIFGKEYDMQRLISFLNVYHAVLIEQKKVSSWN